MQSDDDSIELEICPVENVSFHVSYVGLGGGWFPLRVFTARDLRLQTR